MYADSSTVDNVPTRPLLDVASGEAKAKQAKMVHCETCGFSLNSEAQAAAHYTGRSHLRQLKQLKHGGLATTPTFRPYKPKPAVVKSWSAQTQTATRWGTGLQQPHKTQFGALQTNFRFHSPNAVSSQSFKQNQTMSSLEYSFNSVQSISTTLNYRQPIRNFDQPNVPFGQSTVPFGQSTVPFGQSTVPFGQSIVPYGQSTVPFGQSTVPFGQSIVPFGQSTNPPVQTNVNPVAKAVMDNFLGILPTKRRKIVRCDVCGLNFNSDSQAEAHFKGAKHKRKVQLTSGVSMPVQNKVKNMNSAEGTQPSSASLLHCDICRVSVNSQKQLDAHYQGLNHKNKLGLIESGKTEMRPWTEVEGHKGGWFFCATCNISVPTSAALGQHVLSSEHINRKQAEGF